MTPEHTEEIFCYTCSEFVQLGQCTHVSKCDNCQQLRQIGDWPCSTKHPCGKATRRTAKPFDPILVYEMPDGTHAYPGTNDENAGRPEGGKPVYLTTLRQADEFVRNVNRREQEEIDMRTEARRNHADRVQRESRNQLKAELERRGISRANVDAIMADRDGRGPGREVVMRQFEDVARATGQPFDREKAERIYEQTQRNRRNPEYRSRPQATFGIEVFEKDSSNRHAYRDEATGWKARKG